MNRPLSPGYTLIELMISITLGLLLLAIVVEVFVNARTTYSANSTQGQMQDAELTLSSLLGQSLRTTGFYGCSSTSTMQFITPSFPSLTQSSASLQGFDAGTSTAITTLNGSNDTNTADWTPNIPANFSGLALPGSDILVRLGQRPNTTPTWLSTNTTVGSSSLSVLSVSQLINGGWLAVSNCGQASIYQINGAPTQASSGTSTISLKSDSLVDTPYTQGAVVAPVSAVAFLVAHASGSQSALYQAENTNGTWSLVPLVVGVDSMRIWYGTGSSSSTTQYRSASQLSNSDWSNVTSVRIAFLLEGNTGSSPLINSGTCKNQTSWSLLDRTVTVPCDTRLRHVFTMTISLRNALL